MTTYLLALTYGCALGLLTLTGCGIGRAIVDEQNSPGWGAACVGEPPSCENAVADVPASMAPLSVPLAFAECASTSTPCPATMVGSASSGPSATDVVGCSLNLALSAADSPGLARATCIELMLSPVASAKLVRLADVVLAASTLTLASETPVVVELVRASLHGTRVTLRGPVTLRMVEESSLQNVWMREEPAASGSVGASFELVESRAQGLTLGPLTGRVKMLRSELFDSKLWADSVVLETVSLRDVSVVSPELDGVELKGRGLTLQVGRATLSQLELERLAVQRCDAMLIVSSRLASSTFAACTDKLRLDYTAVSSSLLVGAIESSSGTWLQNTFGGGAAGTSMELWGDSLVSNRFCPGVTRAAFGRALTLQCNVCDELPAPEQRLCPAAMPSDELPRSLLLPEDNPLCPILAELETLAVCSPRVRNENPTNNLF